MAWFKSAFSKVHLALATALGLTILLGTLLALVVQPYSTVATIHFFAGVSIVALPGALLLTMKNRRMVLRAFANRLRLSKKDFTAGKPLALAAKLTVNLLALSVLIQLLTGIGMKTGALVRLLPAVDWYAFHHTFLYIIPSIAALHATSMLLSNRRAARKPKAKQQEPATKLGS